MEFQGWSPEDCLTQAFAPRLFPLLDFARLCGVYRGKDLMRGCARLTAIADLLANLKGPHSRTEDKGSAKRKSDCMRRDASAPTNIIPIPTDIFIYCRDGMANILGRLCNRRTIEMIRVERSPIDGFGVYAARRIPFRTPIIEYTGDIIGNVEADRREGVYHRTKLFGSRACYMFRLNKQVVVDATRRGNEARFINHSCSPNCITFPVRLGCPRLWKARKKPQPEHSLHASKKSGTADAAATVPARADEAGRIKEAKAMEDALTGLDRIVVFAGRDIAEGEELTYDYRFEVESCDADSSNRFPCCCGSPNCRQWLG